MERTDSFSLFINCKTYKRDSANISKKGLQCYDHRMLKLLMWLNTVSSHFSMVIIHSSNDHILWVEKQIEVSLHFKKWFILFEK